MRINIGIRLPGHSKEFKTLKGERIKEEFVGILEKYIKEKHKPSTIYGESFVIKKYILPFFKNMTLSEIEQEDILDFKDSLAHFKRTCTKCITLLNTAFNQAELWKYRLKNTNPCQGVSRYSSKKMNRFLSDEELNRLDQVLLEKKDGGNISSYTLAVFRLLLYTGCRLNEVLTLQWTDVNLEEN